MSTKDGLPNPFVVQNSGRWLGSDGSWSTFYVHAGTPAQHFHVLPNFNGQTLFVPSEEDCRRMNTTDCGTQRGVEIFNSLPSPGFQRNASSTWKELGRYRLDLGAKLGLGGTAAYGYDTFGPGTSRSTDAIKLEKLAIGAYTAPEFWVGQLGLSMFALNMSETEQPHSLLSRMKEEGHVPSLSFAYQAGAPYRFTKVPGSLILGGYDRSRQGNKTLTFTAIQDIIVGLQGISAQLSNGTNIPLLQSGILSILTTNVPEIWLPRSVCDVFASAFNLTYFERADRYVLTQTARSELQKLNPTMSFQIGTSVSGGDTISINIPYAAFDLQAGYPIFGQQTNYFPLRRASNDSQYALGRVFLQEAYLSVDWERDLFNLSQATFNSPPLPVDIVTIEPKNRSDILVLRPGQNNGAKSLSKGAIAGIAIAAVILVLLLGALGWWLHRRRKQKRDTETPQQIPVDEKKDPRDFAPEAVVNEPIGAQKTNLELDGGMIPEMYAPQNRNELRHAMTTKGQIVEADSASPIYELPTTEQHTSKDDK